jgi:glycosyltransferase involved in cell wall biosynthesis
MRVGISTSVIQRGRTGIAQYVFALTHALLPHATQHEFVLFVLEEDLPLFAFVKDKLRLVPVPEKFRPPLRDILWHQTHLPRLARALRLDVLHVPSYRRLLARRPCALVGTVHDLAPFRVTGKYDWKRMFYGRVVVRWLARRQHRIIAISQNTARDIGEFFRVAPERVAVIHNGLDHGRFTPTSASAAKVAVAKQFGLDKPFMLYTARLEHPGKNHVRLIAAFNEFKAATRSPWCLALAGADWHGAAEIHAAAQASPFVADIRRLGFVMPQHLPDLYRAAELFVFPSLYEGFGFPPVEAMACGCPVMSSTRGALGEVVGEAAALVDPEDVSTMARELDALAGDTRRRDQLRAAGLRQAQKFNWGRCASETLRVYEQAVHDWRDAPR